MRTLIALVVVAGCGGGAKTSPPQSPANPAVPSDYRRVEFPGFGVLVPVAAGVGEGSIDDYRTGSVMMAGSDRFMMVNWSTTPSPTVDEIPQLVEANARITWPDKTYKLGTARTVAVGGATATHLDLRLEDRPLAFVAIPCGKRSVLIGFGAAADGDLEAMETTVLGSFRCQPVAAQEARLTDDVPVAVDDPKTLAGWRRLDDAEGAFVITDDKFAIMLDSIADKGASSTENLARLVPDLIKRTVNGTWTAGQLQKRRTADGMRVFQLGTVEIDGEVAGAVFTIWACNEQSVFALGLADGTDATPVIDTMMKLRCARPGDPPLPVAK